uniref:Oxidoreductase-like domain-containing protein n=1 Tax=Alexandrium andersonii TaxID=327968 RepID=A0A7S2F9Q4_9DINO|mmetsp:Transcript_19402/g.44138  ORF Transcript_19402/g.44138 Transcript_19402/m.44138 type:complete len:149 (+) Transcript_19402:75-521(+)
MAALAPLRRVVRWTSLPRPLAKPIATSASRLVAAIPPPLPEDCSEEPDNCCGSGCDPCVWDAYHQSLKGWQRDRLRWEAGANDSGDGHLWLKGFRGKRLREMNGLEVEVVGQDESSGRWRVRPVGGFRMLTLPLEKLALSPPEVSVQC